jgi:hypothetical protein
MTASDLDPSRSRSHRVSHLDFVPRIDTLAERNLECPQLLHSSDLI